MSSFSAKAVTHSLLWQRALILCLLIIYRIMLDFSYEEVARMFDYQGLFSNNKSTSSLLLSWALFICFLPFIVKLFGGNRLSNYVLIFLVVFSLIPQIVVISYRADYSLFFVSLVTCYWMLLLLLHYFIPPIKGRFCPGVLVQKTPYILLVVMLASVLVYSFLTTGLRMHFDLINVYGIREEARGFEVIFPFNYVISFANNALAFFAVLLLHKRRYLFLGLTLFVIFINFSITGTKTIIFVLLCGVLGYYFIRSQKHFYRILIAAVTIIALSLIELIWLDTHVLTGLFPYRVLFIPTELHNSYYGFFQTNELDLYRQSILKFFFQSPYDTNIQFLLGEYSIGDISARANNGLFSDAYMNLGTIGIFIYPFLLVTLLRLFDGVASRIDMRLWSVIAIYMGFALISMIFSTALLTSGLLPFLLMLYTFPSTGITTDRVRSH